MPFTSENQPKGPRKRGRPKGVVSVQTRIRRAMPDLINKVIKQKERITLAAELARGVTVKEIDGRTSQEKVYTKPPDLKAIEWLEAYASGKPISSLELTGKNGERLSIRVEMPPKDGDPTGDV